MPSIIAGRFQTFDQAESASKALLDANIKRHDLSVFYVNPQGQHDATPIGGDHINADPGAKDSTSEAVQGTAAGGAVGLAVGIAAAAAIPIVGPAVVAAAAGVGAYTGSLAGTLRGAGDSDHPAPTPRQAGVLVAVRVDDDAVSQRAVEVLSAEGAADLELAEGTWRNGEWLDFDPVAPPRLIHFSVGTP